MAPIPARTAAQFPFTEELEIAISIGIHSLPLFRASIPRVHGCQRLSKSKKEFTHQYAFRQLVNSIGKLVWIAKLDASKGDIEDRFYQKS